MRLSNEPVLTTDTEGNLLTRLDGDMVPEILSVAYNQARTVLAIEARDGYYLYVRNALGLYDRARTPPDASVPDIRPNVPIFLYANDAGWRRFV